MKYRLVSLLLVPFIFLQTHAYTDKAVFNELVYQIRDPKTNPAQFRRSLKKIGEYLAVQVLEELEQTETSIETLLGESATHTLCNEKPVLITILRAGVPLYLGVQKVFSDSESGFLGMARNEETLAAKTDYVALPDIEGKCVCIIDTMLATGGSILDAVKLIEKYKPKKIIIISAIASEPGIARIAEYNPDIKVYAAAVDPTLNEKGYIVPGLGDAGDRCYGLKIT